MLNSIEVLYAGAIVPAKNIINIYINIYIDGGLCMWAFIQDQVLGMKWLNALIGKILSASGLDISDKFGGTIHFFIYDVIKIVALLCALIFIIS